jgi:PKD repeat protein
MGIFAILLIILLIIMIMLLAVMLQGTASPAASAGSPVGPPIPATFAANESMTVALQTVNKTNPDGNSTVPFANFTAHVAYIYPYILSGEAPLSVKFTDKSTGSVSTYFWDYGDGMTSTKQSPVHTYATPGIYTVALTVSGPYGTDTMTKVHLVTVLANTTVGSGTA